MGQLRQRFLESLPAGRLGEVEEHANLATYILSDYASWLTGSVIVFDGGNLPYMSGMFNDLTKVTPDLIAGVLVHGCPCALMRVYNLYYIIICNPQVKHAMQ